MLWDSGEGQDAVACERGVSKVYEGQGLDGPGRAGAGQSPL